MFFGKNIRYLRAIKGITQADLAEALEVNSATVTGWETGKSYPHFQVLLQLGKFFQVDLDSLVYRDLQNVTKDGEPQHPSSGEGFKEPLDLLQRRVTALEEWRRKAEKE